jgi:hypothetical protein
MLKDELRRLPDHVTANLLRALLCIPRTAERQAAYSPSGMTSSRCSGCVRRAVGKSTISKGRQVSSAISMCQPLQSCFSVSYTITYYRNGASVSGRKIAKHNPVIVGINHQF